RDLYSRFHLASRDRPARVQVVGPVHLRLEVRPVHPAGSTEPLEDWLSVRGAGSQRWFPITDNFPSQGLKLVGEPARVPGSAVLAEVSLGPGLHDLAVSPLSTDVLLRVHAWRPDLSFGVLPLLTPATLLAALSGGSSCPQEEVDRLLCRL